MVTTATGQFRTLCFDNLKGAADKVMQQLGSAGINGILLEGGSSLAFSALKAGIVHRVQAYIAPKLIGGADAKSPVGGEGLAKMADALALKNVRSTPLGEDFLIEGRL